MKDARNYFFAGLMVCVLFFGCDNVTEPENNGVPDNLSPSRGNNELKGKTFENERCKLTFAEDGVTYNSDSSTGLRTAAASDWTELLKYRYSWNSESNPKTLEFQLSQVWGTGAAQGYEQQLAAAKAKVSATVKAVNAALAKEALYSAFGAVKDKAKAQVTARVKDYIHCQQELLETYLESKYGSVIKFKYELTESQLTLTEQFKKDLTDASSNLTATSGDDITFILNDYSNLIPFKVEVGEDVYVGVPDIQKTGADSGRLSVQLYPYYGDMTTGTTVAASISEAVTAKMTEGAGSSMTIIEEFGNGEDSPTLDKLLDEAIGSYLLEATYSLSEDGATLTFTEQRPDFLLSVESVTMTHQPLLGGTFGLAQ